MKYALLFSFLILGCTTTSKMPATKENCSDFYIHINDFKNLSKENSAFEEISSKCQERFGVSVDREKYLSAYRKVRSEKLVSICKCSDGYLSAADPARMMQGGYFFDNTKEALKICSEVNMAQEYEKGIELANQDKKTFKPNYWSGPITLSLKDADTACLKK